MDVPALVAERARQLLGERSRVLVGIDGPDAAGKTTLADRLADHLDEPVVRASVDDFHQPAAVRRRRGELSPDGYYLDAFDHDAVRRQLLAPFRADSASVRTKAFDHRTDSALRVAVTVPPVALLVVDGVFLQKPALAPLWDLTVYLHVPPEETVRRARVRDLHLFASEQELRRTYEQRYLPAQARYRAECDPMAAADLVVDNTDPANPVIL